MPDRGALKMTALGFIAGVATLASCTPVTKTLETPFEEGPQPPDSRTLVLSVAQSLVSTREATGRNDGAVIEAMQGAVGINKGDPYCAAFNYWCYLEAGLGASVPRSGWSPSWVSGPTWSKGAGTTPKPADAFGIWFPSKGRVAHTGLIEDWGSASAITLEANTSPSAEFGGASDRDGDGIWRKRRLIRQIHSVRDWIGQ